MINSLILLYSTLPLLIQSTFAFHQQRPISFTDNAKYVLHSITLSKGDDENVVPELVSRLNLTDQFDRYRFLQRLMEDEEVDDKDVDTLLWCVIETRALKKVQSSEEEDEGVDFILDPCKVNKLIEHHGKPFLTKGERPNPPMEILETILPTIDEDENYHKGLWDTLMEFYGAEMVKVKCEENPKDQDWFDRATVFKALVYFDFLHKGVEDEAQKFQ